MDLQDSLFHVPIMAMVGGHDDSALAHGAHFKRGEPTMVIVEVRVVSLDTDLVGHVIKIQNPHPDRLAEALFRALTSLSRKGIRMGRHPLPPAPASWARLARPIGTS